MGESKPAAEPSQETSALPARQPYEKPAVAWEETLEIRPNLMAACGKESGGSGACETGPAS